MKTGIQRAGALLLCASILSAQDAFPSVDAMLAEANCLYFGNQNKFKAIVRDGKAVPPRTGPSKQGLMTEMVVAQLVPSGTRTYGAQNPTDLGLIDKYIFDKIQKSGVTPAEKTTDYEFCRRITLDLTGRIPTPERVLQFVNDPSPTKRAAYIDELLRSPFWTDKWTMFYGDLFKNNSRNTQIARYPESTKAFYDYIRASLTANKPYDQIARELITATGTDSYQQGELNFLVGGVVTGGPIQDIWDQQTVNVTTVFLGISHTNCLLCHNGRGHLDALSLWGRGTTRQQAWGLSSYLSRTRTSKTQLVAGQAKGYWALEDNLRTDYPLNTTTGNRPVRAPIGTSGNTIPPQYLWNSSKPATGENYRAALARAITSDFQFARATVNYIWEAFYGRGLVTPSDQFDPARLDPDNPPPDPWTLQPSHPELLRDLAQAFIDNKYDLKWLMRTIANSESYQLSSRYDASKWNATWEPLFARKFVRRLWAEEVHDGIQLSSNIINNYSIPIYGQMQWAMQFPETVGTPTGTTGATAIQNFLDSFLRGNRDDEVRRDDGSISQALSMMNDSFVMSRVQSNGPASSLLVRNLSQSNETLVNNLFLAVLSRYPTDAEKQTALANLSNQSTRLAEAENLLWSLYNKVDFLFNY